MKKYKLRKYKSILMVFLILLYLEVIFRLYVGIDIFNISLVYILLFDIFLSLVLNIIYRLFNKLINKIIYIVSILIITLLYIIQVCVYSMFGFYFDLSLFSAVEQVSHFKSDILSVILNNILIIIVLLVPFILCTIFNKYISIDKDKFKNRLIKVLCIIFVYVVFIFSLKLDNDVYRLYYEVNNTSLNIESFGVIHASIIDLERTIFGFKESITIIENESTEEDPKEEEEIIYEYNNLDIDFDELIEESSDDTITLMHEYFKNETGTLQNEYTSYFEGKNLILFMAESFNEIAVSEELTPTLYKLVNSGFVFENFYSPTISSTIGGEYQELTGLIATSGFLSTWKSGENYFPMGIATSFERLGYSTYAYHDHTYTFQSRYKYLSSIGFTNFTACGNGLETKINCNTWPESDVEMISSTIDDYINDDEFFVYYVTVSGHGDYSFSQSATAKKHQSEVEDLPYSESVKAYLASQIELDQALELLIEKLEEAGKLEDTVIALVGDHYPYYLSIDEVNEVSDYEKDSVVEVNHSNFILWNSEMETVTVEKVASQIDVLPTIYNLFGVEYDSRLIIGKDILSTEDGLAIFGNSSWVSDFGTYYASSKTFVARDGVEVSDDYVSKMNTIVSNKIVMSKYIIVNDYYSYFRKVFGD